MTDRKFREPLKRSFSEPSKKQGAVGGSLRGSRRRKPVKRPSARSFRDVVSSAVSILRRSSLAYMVTGGAALPFHGRARTTADVDIIVERDIEKLKRFVEALNRTGFTIPWEWVEASLEEKTHFTVQDTHSPYRLDVKVLEPTEELGRTVEMTLDGKPIRIAAPEELILHKLRFASDIDVEDARSIIIRYGENLDLEYLLRKAGEFAVRERLVQLLREENVEFE